MDLLRFSLSVDSRAFMLTAAVSLTGSLAEGASLVILLPLLAAAGMTFPNGTMPGRLADISQALLSRLGLPHPLWLPTVLAVFLLTGATRSVLRRTQMTLTYTTTNTVQLTLSRRIYAAVVRAQWGFLVRQRAGRLTHLLTEQLGKVTEAIALSLSLINLLCLTLLYFVLALKLSVAMTAIVLALGAVLMLLQRRAISRSRRSGEKLTNSIGEVFAATEEHLLNLKSVKTYDAEDRDIDLFSSLCRDVVQNSVASARHQAGAALRFELGSLLELGAIIYLALGILHVQAATMLLLLGIFTRLMPQLAALQSQTHQFAAALPAYDDVRSIERECLAHAEPPLHPNIATQLTLTRELRVDDLWFAYESRLSSPDPASPDWVLRGLNLTIEAGILTAVAGASGAGKSTLADILNGLLAPARGRIILDGRELSTGDLRQWRRCVGYVGQETVLFHQTIRDNLLWAQPGASAAELDQALRLASAGFVYDLPGGLDAIAGDRGILLSSGQRQRIALARALLRRPSLLILDEATNALDEDNESRILDALLEAVDTLQGSLTVLMIAHRATALRRAHRIFEIQEGRIAGILSTEDLRVRVGKGTHSISTNR